MKKIVQRLLIFFLGIPIIIAIVIFFPHYNHLVLNLAVVLFSAMGAAEFSVILSQKKLFIPKKEAAVLGALTPAAVVMVVVFKSNAYILPVVFIAAVIWLLLSRTFSKGEALDGFINHLAAGFATLIYPGMLLAWIVGMSQWEKSSSIVILTFLTAVFSCDSAAWAVGKLFGKGNQGIIPASPNKSAAGFIGGAIAPVLVCITAAMFWPGIFIPKYTSIFGNPIVAGSILGLLTGTSATLGDLAESAIKRSSGIKDSGNIILGRGGALDSVDSIAMAAPVYFIAFTQLFNP
jgi:phosphatidate cytidylyltransferase